MNAGTTGLKNMLLQGILLTFWWFAQEADTPKLIEQLGDTDPAIRTLAESSLRKLGETALPALLKASQNSDQEQAQRAATLADEIDFRLRGRIVYWRREGGELEANLLNPGTGQVRTIFKAPNRGALQGAIQLHFCWVPGREVLVILSEHPTRNDWTALLGWVVRLREGRTEAISGDLGELRTLSCPGACSPTGHEVVFTSASRHLEVLDVDQMTRRRLQTPEGTPEWGTWSQDGTKLAFNRVGNGAYIVAFDGGRVESVSEKPLVEACFTRAGDALIGLLHDERRQAHDLVRISLAGREVSVLRRDVTWERPAISPDGKRLVYGREKGDNLPEIVVMNLDGSEEFVIGKGTGANWSPDGSNLVFERKQHIFLANLMNKTEKELGEGKFPTWSR